MTAHPTGDHERAQGFDRGAANHTAPFAVCWWGPRRKKHVAVRLQYLLTAILLAGLLLSPGVALAQTEPPVAEPPVVDAAGAASAPDLTAAASDAQDWPMYQHDPAHSGRTPATAYTGSPLYLQWAYAFGERVEVESQPVVVAGILYQGVMNGEMHAINANTGKRVWMVKRGGPIAHTAAVSEGRVFYGSLDWRVYALNAADGVLLWSYKTGAPVVSAPLVVDGVVYIGSNDGSLYALDAATGALRWQVNTGGPVLSSPAFSNGRIFFGSEDLKARAVDAVSGEIRWETQLYGVSMKNTHPVIADEGGVVIFVTVKPGAGSYVPLEGYPNVDPGVDPVDTWNRFYQSRPKYRPLYYLSAETGEDLWNAGARRFTPLPIPYWGLLHPIIGPDGAAYFAAPSGARDAAFHLDHDDRLFRTDLSTGETTAIAGGPGQPEFQTRPDETGRPIFSGGEIVYTSSEDLSVFRPASGSTTVLFGDGNAPYYDIGSHMNPLGPLPSRHLWRYGGAIAMGGVPGGSVPVAANNQIYYSAYSWLYAVGSQNRGYKTATSFPKRDGRAYPLTYPEANALSTAQIRAEVSRRVADLIARGPDNPPVVARWDQPGNRMSYNETTFEVYGSEAELVRALAESLRWLPADQQAELKIYLKAVVERSLLSPEAYAYETRCLIYGEEGVRGGEECKQDNLVMSVWLNNNPNLTAMKLYALWAYGNYTGDWEGIRAGWNTVILPEFARFTQAYNKTLGFVSFEQWLVGRLNIPAQIHAAQAVRDMAAKIPDTTVKTRAQTLLSNLLTTRVSLGGFVYRQYVNGKIKPAPLRLNADGTLVYTDVMGPNSPYNNELIPYSAAVRNRDTDPRQVNWWDGKTARIDTGTGFMHYQAMSGYFPLTSELSARLRARLLTKTDYFLKSYEINNPWWWMSDMAHHTTSSGEHLYHSPTLAWSMFQVKANVTKLPFDTLVRQLPEPMSFNSQYDLYRLQNLTTLLAVCQSQKCAR